MNTFDGYIRRNGTNSKVLLDGGNIKALSEFIGTISYANDKITYTKADGSASYDLVNLSTYNLVVATNDKLGGIKIGYLESGNNYAVLLDSSNKAYVSVPHYATSMYIGENNDTKANKAVNNPYFKLFDNNIRRSTLRFVAGTGIGIASDANGNITITNSSPDQNHNTDKTGIKLGTISGTKKTDSTVIINNSSTGLTIEGGTNKFSIGDGTNYIEVPVTPSFIVSNKDATIGTSLTTIATIAGTDIKAKIDSYLPLSGGTMDSGAMIIWKDWGQWGASSPTYPKANGGLQWSGTSDNLKLFAEETNSDDLRLILQCGDDVSPQFNIRNSAGTTTVSLHSNGTITGTSIVNSGSSDSYVLLGGGGTKLISDFLTSQYTTGLYIGATEAKSNAQTTNGNTYIKLFDDDTRRSNFKISGTQNVSVSSDANGNITITGPNLSGLAVSENLNNYLPLTGGTLYNSTTNTPLIIKGLNNGAYILFTKNDGTNYGHFGFDSDSKPVVYITSSRCTLLHSGNSGISNGVITINGNTITPITSLSGYATEQFVTNKLSSVLDIQIVTTLPTLDINTKTLYLMSASNTDTNDLYKEYVYINKGTEANPNWDWEILGTVHLNYSDFVTALSFSDNKLQWTKGSTAQTGIEIGYASSAGNAEYITSPYAGYNIDTITDSTTSDNMYKAYNGTLYPVFHTTDWGWSDTLYWSGYGRYGGTELATQYNADSNVRVKIRKYYQGTSNWGNWTEFITSGNIGSQSVNYATSAESATKLATARTIWGQSFDGSNDITGHLKLGGYLYMLFGGEWLSTIDNDDNGPIFGYLLASKNRRAYYVGSPVYICGGSYSKYASGITVNSSNNVGIGTTSPSYKLDVNGSSHLGGNTLISSASWGNQLILNRTSATGSWGPSILFNYDGTNNGSLTMASNELYVGNNGGVRYKVYHTNNLPAYPTKASWNYDDVYLKLSGGTLTGHLTIKTSTYRDLLTIYRNENNKNSVINFSNKDGFLGAIGFTGLGQTGMTEKPHVVLKDGTLYTLLHSGNTSISNGTITINGTSITPLTSHQSLSNYHPLNGKISISGGKYNWNNIQQYNSSNANPSYFIPESAIINITSYTGWQPWIRATGSDYGSWALGNYTTNVHLIHFDKSNTGNGSGNQSWSWYSDGTFAMTYNNDWLTNATIQLGRKKSTGVASDRAVIGVTNGNLHIDTYKDHGIYLNYYSSSGSVYFNGSTYYINGGNYNGNSATASKLTTDAGSSTQPVYFSNGVPTACSYQLNKTVPSDAVFTDTHVTQHLTNNNANLPILLSTSGITDATIDATSYTIRNNSIYANPSEGSITANKFNGSATHADTSSQSGFVENHGDNLEHYWMKLWEYNSRRKQVDTDITFLLQSAYEGKQGTLHIKIRQNGDGGSTGWKLDSSMRLTSGNIDKTRVRLYYNDSTGNCQLWYNCLFKWGCINAKMLCKTWRNSEEVPTLGTMYSTTTDVLQTLPGTGYKYIEPTYAVISEWNGVQNKPSSYPVQLKQDISTNVNYPLVWTTSASDANEPQSALYKSFNKLLYNPSRSWLRSGTLELYPETTESYTLGIRIHSTVYDTAALYFCGSDNTGTSGTSVNSWFFGTKNGNIYLNRLVAATAGPNRLWGHSNGYTIGNTTENSHNFTVGGTSRFIGTTTTSHIVPASDYTYNIGSNAAEYANVFSRVVFARHLNASGPCNDKGLYLGYYSTTNILFYVTDADGNNRKRVAKFKQDGSATFDRTVTAASFYSSSDIRLKNIISNPIYKAEDFANLDLVKYTWKGKDDKVYLGSIAQSVEKEFSELISTNQDGYKSLDYSVLGTIGVISLAKEIIELKEEIKELKSKLYG